MQEVKKNLHVSSNVSGSNSFGMKVTSNSFRILIDGLYQHKILAFVRELGTNAYEAHQLVNKEKMPFLVTLPDAANPQFKIRDFGPGLTEEQVRKTYTVTFESTKTNDNKFGGGFGLGSKTPFAYASNFVVVSIVDGKKYMYSFFYNASGEPSFSDPIVSDTNEPSGLEVIIPIKSNDFATVLTAATSCYRHFITVPTVWRGNQQVAINPPQATLIGKSFSLYQNDNYRNPQVRVANLLYPVNSNQINYQGLDRCGIVLNANIGDVHPTPSRENISYDPKTIANINNLFIQAKQEIVSSIQPNVDACIDYHDAMIKLSTLISGLPLRFNDFTYKGVAANAHINIKDNDDLVYVKAKNHYGSLVKLESDTYQRNATDVFVVIDTKSYHNEAIKSLPNLRHVFIYNEVKNPGKVEKFIARMGIDRSKVIRTSTIPVVRTKSAPSKSHKQDVLKWRFSSSISGSWSDEVIDIDADTGVFVQYHANKIKMADGRILDPSTLQELVNLTGYTGTIYGIRGSMIEKFQDHKNWTDFFDFSRQKVYNVAAKCNPEASIKAEQILNATEKLGNSYHNLIFYKTNNVPVTHPALKELIDDVTYLQNLLATKQSKSCKTVFKCFYPTEEKNVSLTKVSVPNLPDKIVKFNNKYPLFQEIRYYNMNKVTCTELEKYLHAIGV